MKQIVTSGIILSRTNYGEADRIITVLTPDRGKLRLMVRGVRKANSKLAGGIELFSISDLTYIEGKGEIGTLISSRLQKYYGQIVANIERVQLGYELIKQLNRVTEDYPEAAYFDLLQQGFAALDDPTIELDIITAWFQAQLLRQAGHAPNLKTDVNHAKLDPELTYNFDLEAMTFVPNPSGNFRAADIKTLRLLFDGHYPTKLQQVQGITDQLVGLTPLLQNMLTYHVHI